MQILLDEKEKKIIDFISELNSVQNKEIIIRFLIDKGISGLSKKLKDIPEPVSDFLNKLLKK